MMLFHVSVSCPSFFILLISFKKMERKNVMGLSGIRKENMCISGR